MFMSDDREELKEVADRINEVRHSIYKNRRDKENIEAYVVWAKGEIIMKIIIEREAKDEKNTMVNVTEEGYGGYLEMEIIEITIKEFTPLMYGHMTIIYKDKKKEPVRISNIREITHSGYYDIQIEYIEHDYSNNTTTYKTFEIENQRHASKENKIKEIRIWEEDLSHWE